MIERLFFSARARVRPEYTHNFSNFDSDIDDEDEFTTGRFRLGMGADLPMETGAYIEVQSVHFWGDDSVSTGNFDLIDDDEINLYEGYLEARDVYDLGGHLFGVKAGRQELVYGTEMLLGDADFGGGLTHDAVKITLESDHSSTHFFYAREVG